MFISEDEYILSGTDAGYVSAKRVEGVWTISLPPKHVNDPRFADVETRFASVLADLEANTIPVDIIPVRGNIQNMANGTPLSEVRRRADARINRAQSAKESALARVADRKKSKK